MHSPSHPLRSISGVSTAQPADEQRLSSADGKTVGGPLVQLQVWRVRSTAVVLAMARVGYQRWSLRRVPGLRFAKLLGTGSGRTFTPRDADLHHWALLTVFDDESAVQAFRTSLQVRSWRRIATEELLVQMRPLSSTGTWAGQDPFASAVPQRWDGPVAAITRAQIKPRLWRKFWSAVPPVVLDLSTREGLLFSIGIGEAPVGLQGTFSIWTSNRELTQFAYRSPAHQRAITATDQLQWYAEELFARLAVTSVSGTFLGRDPLAETGRP